MDVTATQLPLEGARVYDHAKKLWLSQLQTLVPTKCANSSTNEAGTSTKVTRYKLPSVPGRMLIDRVWIQGTIEAVCEGSEPSTSYIILRDATDKCAVETPSPETRNGSVGQAVSVIAKLQAPGSKKGKGPKVAEAGHQFLGPRLVAHRVTPVAGDADLEAALFLLEVVAWQHEARQAAAAQGHWLQL